MADYDPVLEQMLADLGGSRRDYISAPAADARGHVVEVDERAEAAVVEADHLRRQRLQVAATQNSTAAALSAWNNVENFGSDLCTEALGNHMSGQGHRASIQRSGGHFDAQRERREMKVGTERMLYLEQKRLASTSDGHSAASAPPRANTTSRASASRKSPLANVHASRPRAPSPRAAGTVRFLHDQRVDKGNGVRVTSATIPTKSIPPPAVAKVSPKAKKKAASRSVSMPTTPPPPRAVKTTEPTEEEKNKLRDLALWHAANPGPEADKYLKKNPTQAGRLRIARIMIVDDAVFYAPIPQSAEAVVYYTRHPERKWFLTQAVHLRELLVRNKLSTFRDFVEQNPDIEDVAEAMEKSFAAATNAANPTVREVSKQTILTTPKQSLVEPDTIAGRVKRRSIERTKNAQMTQGDHAESPSPASRIKSTYSNGSEGVKKPDTAVKNLGQPGAASPERRTGQLEMQISIVPSELASTRKFSVDSRLSGKVELVVSSSGWDIAQLLEKMEKFALSLQKREPVFEGARRDEEGLWVEV